MPKEIDFGPTATSTKYDGWYNLSIGAKTRTVHGDEITINGLSGYPTTFTSSNAYANPIASQRYSTDGATPTVNSTNATGSGRANLTKVANANGTGGLDKFNADGTRNATTWNGSGFGPYPAGESIYGISFSNVYNAKGGTFGIFEANPLSNLSTVVFQIELGSANGYDFWNPSVPSNAETPLGTANFTSIGTLNLEDYADLFPKLSLTFADSFTLSLDVDFGELLAKGYNGTIPMPTGPGGTDVDEPIWINLYGFQWDLTSDEVTDALALHGAISSFVVTTDVVEHTQTYAMQLDQSDTFTQVIGTGTVPEPSTNALILFAGIALLIWRQKMRRLAV